MSEKTSFDKSYWEERWKNDQTGWDIGHASTPLVEYFKLLEDKSIKILIPGCGNAYEGELLHSEGFTNIYLIDMAKSALDSFSNRYPDFPKNHLIHANFFDLDDSFDLIVEQTFFCALDPSFRKAYVEKSFDLLNENGILMGVLFNKIFENTGPPFGGDIEEYLGLFQRKFLVRTLEECHNSIKPRQGIEVFMELMKG